MSSLKQSVRKSQQLESQPNQEGLSFDDFQNLSDVQSQKSETSEQQFQKNMGQYKNLNSGGVSGNHNFYQQNEDDRNHEEEFEGLETNLGDIQYPHQMEEDDQDQGEPQEDEENYGEENVEEQEEEEEERIQKIDHRNFTKSQQEYYRIKELQQKMAEQQINNQSANNKFKKIPVSRQLNPDDYKKNYIAATGNKNRESQNSNKYDKEPQDNHNQNYSGNSNNQINLPKRHQNYQRSQKSESFQQQKQLLQNPNQLENLPPKYDFKRNRESKDQPDGFQKKQDNITAYNNNFSIKQTQPPQNQRLQNEYEQYERKNFEVNRGNQQYAEQYQNDNYGEEQVEDQQGYGEGEGHGRLQQNQGSVQEQENYESTDGNQRGEQVEREYNDDQQDIPPVDEQAIEDIIDKISASVLQLKERSEFLNLRESVLKSRKKQIDQSQAEMKTFVARQMESLKEYINEQTTKFNSDLQEIFLKLHTRFQNDVETLQKESDFTSQRFELYKSVIDSSDIGIIWGFCNQNFSEIEELLGQNLSQYFAEQAECFPSINFRKQDLQQDQDIQHLVQNISNFTSGIVQKGQSILTERFQAFIDERIFPAANIQTSNQKISTNASPNQFAHHRLNSYGNDVSPKLAEENEKMIQNFFNRSQEKNIFSGSNRKTQSPNLQDSISQNQQYQQISLNNPKAIPHTRDSPSRSHTENMSSHQRSESISNQVRSIQSQLNSLFASNSSSKMGTSQRGAYLSHSQPESSNSNAQNLFERKCESSLDRKQFRPDRGERSPRETISSEWLALKMKRDDRKASVSPKSQLSITRVHIQSPQNNKNLQTTSLLNGHKQSFNADISHGLYNNGSKSQYTLLRESDSQRINQNFGSPKRIELRQSSVEQSHSPQVNRFLISLPKPQEDENQKFQALNILKQQNKLFQQGKQSFFE